MDAPPQEDPCPRLVQFCRSDGCRQLMGPLRVYLGAGDPSRRRHLRGSGVHTIADEDAMKTRGGRQVKARPERVSHCIVGRSFAGSANR